MTARTDDLESGPVPPVPDDGPTMWAVAAATFEQWRTSRRPEHLDDLVRMLTPSLWHFVRAYDLNRHEAEEAIQRTWLALLHSAESIRDTRAVGGWLRTTARREAAKARPNRQRETPVGEWTVDVPDDPAGDPAVVVVVDDSTRRLWSHVTRLSDRCRQLLRVIAFEDRPDYAELSEQLGMKIGSIGPTRLRCLAKLRRLLAADPEWSDR